MTGAENERLAVVETKMSLAVADIAEIKQDVKTLLASRSRLSGMATLLMSALPIMSIIIAGIALVAR